MGAVSARFHLNGYPECRLGESVARRVGLAHAAGQRVLIASTTPFSM
jgi:hypothetical protein